MSLFRELLPPENYIIFLLFICGHKNAFSGCEQKKVARVTCYCKTQYGDISQ